MKRMDKYFGMSPRIARWKLNNGFENLLGKWACLLYTSPSPRDA